MQNKQSTSHIEFIPELIDMNKITQLIDKNSIFPPDRL